MEVQIKRLAAFADIARALLVLADLGADRLLSSTLVNLNMDGDLPPNFCDLRRHQTLSSDEVLHLARRATAPLPSARTVSIR